MFDRTGPRAVFLNMLHRNSCTCARCGRDFVKSNEGLPFLSDKIVYYCLDPTGHVFSLLYYLQAPILAYNCVIGFRIGYFIIYCDT